MTLLSVSNLSVNFGATRAINGISFDLKKGEMLAIVGESGSGKSVTALACMGLLPQSATLSGNIALNETTITGANDAALRKLRGNRIAMIFQEPMSALNPLHTIRKQITEILLIHQPPHTMWGQVAPTPSGSRRPALRGSTSQARRGDNHQPRILELLALVGLSHLHDRLDAYPHQLSGGERQRVMIAMAIANNPDVLIADEPTTAVDVTVQATILKTLKNLQRTLGMSILFITHDLTIVKRLADRVAVMKQGEIVEVGEVSRVFSYPAHPYTQHLLSSEPKGAAAFYDARAREVVMCDNLRVHFPIRRGVFGRVSGHVKAVDGVSLSIPQGATLGVVGESGSGKSTLGFALLKLVPSMGRVVFMGQLLEGVKGKELKALRKSMQLVFQDPYGSLNPRMTVFQIISEGLRVHAPSMDEAALEQAVEQILVEVGLEPAMKTRYPHEFSGGQRQRISIARAMILKPQLVVLDEPTSALDLSVQAQVIELLRRFQQAYGTSYIFISHDLRVVRAIAHRILVMKAGRVVEMGETHQIFTSPRNDYTQALIKAAFLEE